MFGYKHLDTQDNPIDLPVGKVVCVGRNYMQHIQELNNTVPTEPLLFIKPATALTPLKQPIVIPKDLGACHNELEVAVLINYPLTKASLEDVKRSIWGVGLGLDLTLREVQSALKQQGHPWERAKAFDHSCPMSQFVNKEQITGLNDIEFSLHVNNALRQLGNTQNMLFSIVDLLVNISHTFTLLPGDIVMTGTPKDVAALEPKDLLRVELNKHFLVETSVD